MENYSRKQSSQVLFGNRLQGRAPSLPPKDIACYLNGMDATNNRVSLPVSKEILSRHLMLLGGIGCGKTNTFFQIVSQIREKLQDDEVMVIFDTKGDFYEEFYQPGDVVISNDETATGPDWENYWNIFNEIENGPRMMESVIEISKNLFAEACEKTSQVFFPNAARDIFTAILIHFIRAKEPEERTNDNLSRYINSTPSWEIREMLESYDEFRAMSSYIMNDDSAQTQGVISELQQVTREIFIGNFAKYGSLGMRQLVRQKGGRLIFIEYDLSLGEMLSPIYSLLFDLAIKESICRERSKGNVYFVTDEFRLLPHLKHIDDAVNFGRSLGVKFMIGIQNVEQIYENYGEQRARSIMSGFLSTFVFRLTDEKSRQHVQGIFGKNRKLEAYTPIIQTRGVVEETRDANVVEDWNITNLNTGQAIIGLPNKEPFLFAFDRYIEKGK